MRLGVNIDHIATLRQARQEDFPDPVEAAREAVANVRATRRWDGCLRWRILGLPVASVR